MNDATNDGPRGTSRDRTPDKVPAEALIGNSTVRNLREWRHFLASNALADTAKPISHFAEEASYDTAAAFSRAFSSLDGVPPARWRAGSQGSARRDA